MYQKQNNKKILSSHNLNLIMVLIKIITIKLKYLIISQKWKIKMETRQKNKETIIL
jgi:hypothetical protein